MSKQIIEDVIKDVLKDNAKKNALDLITWLRENKMNPSRASAVSWKISCKACVVCYIRFEFDAGCMRVSPIIGEYEHDSISDELKKIIMANKTAGRPCGERCHTCSYIINTIFGKEYDDACGQSIVFTNPGADEIECIKKLLLMRRNIIQTGKLLPALPRNLG
jgi:hypothetical protein